jgi:nicotinamide-nucleotide amidase
MENKTRINAQPDVLVETKEYLDRISQSCLKQKLTISVAESVTSGFLQLLFSNAINTQRFFQGGITAYNGAQKTKHLNIEPIYASQCNCVSQKISIEMALNVSAIFCSEIGIGITGYATSVPEENITELFAYVAIVKQGKVVYKAKIKPRHTQIQGWAVQQDYAVQVLKQLSERLNE